MPRKSDTCCAYLLSSNEFFSNLTEKVLIKSVVLSFFALATIKLESSPPLRKNPKGTSDCILFFVAFDINCVNSEDISLTEYFKKLSSGSILKSKYFLIIILEVLILNLINEPGSSLKTLLYIVRGDGI